MVVMDPQVQASFIPKKSLEMTNTRGGGFGGLLFLITLLIFIASLVAAGAAFAYTQYLTSAITTKAKSLTLAEGAYDPGTIDDLTRLDTRLTQAKLLLDKHVAASGIFAFLGTQTLVNVSFSNFSYTLGDDGSAKISMAGSADSFSSVALQSDQFDGNKLLKDVSFTGISADPQGRVNFTVSATIDPSILSYSTTLGQSAAVPTVPSASSTAPASTGAFAPSTTPSQ
jgi:hypothetical protein